MKHFDDDLAFSQECSNLPLWEEIYRQAFADFDGMRLVREDGVGQRKGVDRQIFLKGSDRTIRVDEKARRRVYPDIALEYQDESYNGRRLRPGWIEKQQHCDYLAYAFIPSGRAYLLPFQQLRAVWQRYGSQWISGYKRIASENPGYITVSVGVPKDVLFKAIGETLRINFTPPDGLEHIAPIADRVMADLFEAYECSRCRSPAELFALGGQRFCRPCLGRARKLGGQE